MNIVVTANAKKRLKQIFNYYCDKDLPAVALRIKTSIENSILYLEKFPRMGAVEEQFYILVPRLNVEQTSRGTSVGFNSYWLYCSR